MTNTEVQKLTGHEAIAYAEAHDLTLSKYADPIEDERDGLTIEEAIAVANGDPSLIYIDTRKQTGRYEVRVIGSGEFGDLLLATDSRSEANAAAERKGMNYYYGVAIIDTKKQMVNLGDCIVPLEDAFCMYEIDLTNVPDGAYTEDYLGKNRSQPTLAAAKKVVAQFERDKKATPQNFEPGMVAKIVRTPV